ncbi:thermonuclease family protein [Methylopila musalis]|uniref:Thermonuclease family protein n=1 Tax=Methylopila musalis TaxID=1134781 RepID=A0ABW3Z704_9HYPH
MILAARSFSLFARLRDIALGAALGVAGALAVSGSMPAPRGATLPTTPAAGPVFTARALTVIDGDTFEARVAAFPGQEIVTRVRISGVDTPERRGRCAGETRAARAATKALERLLRDRRLTLTDLRGDKYFGRVVARVAADGVGDVSRRLIADGHGRPYDGGRREGWC